MIENEIIQSAALAVAFRKSLAIPADMHEIAAEIAMVTEPSVDLVHQVITKYSGDIDYTVDAIFILLSRRLFER